VSNSQVVCHSWQEAEVFSLFAITLTVTIYSSECVIDRYFKY